jgi:predicted neuraminidase
MLHFMLVATRSGVAISSVAFISLAAIASARAQSQFVFQPGSAPFASSHASTLVELSDGSLLAAWFAGTGEGNPDVAIWSSHRVQGAWSVPVELAREEGVPCWNPVLFHTRDHRLWLYYKFGPSPETWTAARKFSSDEGKSWSTAEHLPAGLIGPVRAKPLVLADGTIVSGSSVESYLSWAAWIERSTDDGKTWTKIGPLVPIRGSEDLKRTFGIIQPSVVQIGGRHLRFYARSTSSIARVVVADSYDEGATWTSPRPLNVPNPNSGIDAVVLKDGRVVLVYNNTTSGRTPLNMAVSHDGEHFKMFLTLEDQPGEYSYPAMIQDSKGDLDITYTWQRKAIRFVHIALAKVPQ